MGRSLERSFASLCRQKRYVSVKNLLVMSGTCPWYIRSNNALMLSLIMLSLSLVSEVKISMESALRPVPLFLGACFMVWHMSPRMWCVWVGVGWCGKFRVGTGSV